MKWQRRDFNVSMFGPSAGCFGIWEHRESEFAVTHIPTGCRVNKVHFRNLDTAKQFVEKITPMCDWSKIREYPKSDTVRNAIKKRVRVIENQLLRKESK